MLASTIEHVVIQIAMGNLIKEYLHAAGIHLRQYQTAYSDESGQRFRAKLDTHSGANWTVGA